MKIKDVIDAFSKYDPESEVSIEYNTLWEQVEIEVVENGTYIRVYAGGNMFYPNFDPVTADSEPNQ